MSAHMERCQRVTKYNYRSQATIHHCQLYKEINVLHVRNGIGSMANISVSLSKLCQETRLATHTTQHVTQPPLVLPKAHSITQNYSYAVYY